jgi:hypothetical protein
LKRTVSGSLIQRNSVSESPGRIEDSLTLASWRSDTAIGIANAYQPAEDGATGHSAILHPPVQLCRAHAKIPPCPPAADLLSFCRDIHARAVAKTGGRFALRKRVPA